VERGNFPAVDPLASYSRILDPRIVGAEAPMRRAAVKIHSAALRGPAGHHCHSRIENFPTKDKRTVARARKIEKFLSQPMFGRRAVHRPEEIRED